MLDDQSATDVTWYHTSVLQNWPAPLDHGATLNDETRQRMHDPDTWVHRQNTKALHVGNYESAVHNMLRRMHDQSGKGEQFYLYGVRLRPDVAILPGSTAEQSRWGDVWLDEIASPEIDVVRYVNVYEDPGRLSAAIRRSAIAAVQCLPIPLAIADADACVGDAAGRLQAAATDPLPLLDGEYPFLPRPTYRNEAAQQVARDLAEELPATMRHQFESAVRWDAADDPAEWARYARSLFALVLDADRVLGELAKQPVREL